MKAAVYYGPGDVRIEQVPEPGPPGPDEVVVRVTMGSLCGTDVAQFQAATMVPLTHPHPASGHCGPVILGHEVVGTVVARGKNVRHLTSGTRVVPGAGMWCGTCALCRADRANICEQAYLYGIHAHGGLADYATFPAKMCVPVPAGCPDAVAVLAQPCAVALHALARAQIATTRTIALFGVGALGSLLFAVLRTQALVEQQILAVDKHPARLETARALGATQVIDASETDPVEAIRAATQGKGVEVAIEATGQPSVISQALASLRRGGCLLQVGIAHGLTSLDLASAVQQELTILTTNGMSGPIELRHALDLLASTDLATRIRTQTIALDALVDEGLRPLAEGRATGKVLVQIAA